MNCTITYPWSHNKCYILRWYEWDLLVFCKQTSFYMAAIGTLRLAYLPNGSQLPVPVFTNHSWIRSWSFPSDFFFFIIYLEALGRNASFSWLNHIVKPMRSWVRFFTNAWRKMLSIFSWEWLVNTDPGYLSWNT